MMVRIMVKIVAQNIRPVRLTRTIRREGIRGVGPAHLLAPNEDWPSPEFLGLCHCSRRVGLPTSGWPPRAGAVCKLVGLVVENPKAPAQPTKPP